MKTILATINAKFIHTSLALRLLYVVSKDEHDVEIKEYTLKENVEAIASDVLSSNPDVVALGIYIWNVNQSKALVECLKASKPNLVIILGGPEVTYEAEFFASNWTVDYIIRGEGEFVLKNLLHKIKESKASEKNKGGVDSHIKIESVYSTTHRDATIAKVNLSELEKYDSPYTLEMDVKDKKNKILYFETSRGCPYRCQYCLSSLETGVRYFSKEYILDNLKKIIASDVKTIKFLDRTFNLNKSHTEMIFDCLIQNYRPNLSCQFEIYADILSDETIQKLNNILPENYFRFEIGIQSTYEPTNIAVKRKQNFPLIQKNIHQIMQGGKIDLHLDLIAGLPHETYTLFEKSFNDVFDFGAKELQLGFLKMLRGTKLREDADKYGYLYEVEAPYQIISNESLSVVEVDRIHSMENMLEKYWNSGKFSLSLNHVLFQYFKGEYYLFFDELAMFFENYQKDKNLLRLEDLFIILQLFLESKSIEVFSLLRKDYYNNYIIRPHGFWESSLDKSNKKKLLYEIGNDKKFTSTIQLNRKQIEKQMTIDEYEDNSYLLTYFDGKTKIHQEYIYKKS